MTKRYKWTILLSLLTVPLLLIAISFANGGHGSYIPAMAFFPFGLLSIIFNSRITIPFVVLAIIQYLIYGFIIDKAILTNRSKTILTILILIHVILAVIIIKMTGENWN